MKNLDCVIAALRKENYDPVIKTDYHKDISWSKIFWKDENGDECSIFESNIAVEGNKISWFQTSKADKHQLIVYENNVKFVWTPITYNPVFGCYSLLVEWYKDHLIFIYQEKHQIYICSIKNFIVKHFSFHGEEIERKDDLISYESHMNKIPNKIRLIKLPELTELTPIEKDIAEQSGLLPIGLNRPGNFLASR